MSAKRSTLTLSEKEKIALDFKNSNLSKARFAVERGVPRTTLNNILSSHRVGNGKRKRMRSSAYKKVEEALLQWTKIARPLNVPISYSMLKEMALEIASELGEPNFIASNGWIQRFKLRHDLTFKTVCEAGDETRDIDETILNDWENFVLEGKKSVMKAAKANGTADGASTSDSRTTDNSVGHSCSSTLEKKDGACSSSEMRGALLPSGNGEIITPDIGMENSGETEMETSPNLLNGSGIVIKQEIIETEEESCAFTSSFHPPFTNGPTHGQRPRTSDTTFDDSSFNPPFTINPSDHQRPGTSDTTHSDSSNSNCTVLTSGPALVATTSAINRSEKIEPSVSSKSCDVGSRKHCGISNLESFVRQVGIPSHVGPPSLPQTLSSSFNTQVNNPYYVNPNVQSNNGQIQVGVPSHAGPPCLPQTLTGSNHIYNPDYAHSNGQSHPSVPFRQKDNFDIFGEFVASKLRSLDLKSAAYVLSAFSDLIYKVESRMLSNDNEKIRADTQTVDSEKSLPIPKENIQPIIHTENSSLPPAADNIGSKNSSRTELCQPTTLNQNLCPPVSNPTIPQIITMTDSNPTTISSQSNNSSGPPSLSTTSWSDAAIKAGISVQSRPSGPYHTQPGVPYSTQTRAPYNTQPSVPYNTRPNFPYHTQPCAPCYTRPKDKWDNFGEFVASKLRILDSKSSIFVQTAIADLIFKAELGKFSSEKSFFSNRTNDFHQNRFPSNVQSQQTNVSNVPGGYVIPSQVGFVPQNCCVGQVPIVNVPPN